MEEKPKTGIIARIRRMSSVSLSWSRRSSGDSTTPVAVQLHYPSDPIPIDYRFGVQRVDHIEQAEQVAVVNEPFGDESNAEVKYKTLAWWQCGLLLVAETISLGILSLPAVVATVGFVPGMILIVSLGFITTYTGYVIGQFKHAFPHVHSYADAGELMFGRFGKEFAEVCQMLVFLFIMGAHILTFSVMMNVLTGHATCSLVFGAAGAIISFVLTIPRTMKNMSYISIFSCISVATAVIITMVGVGISKPGVGQTFAVVPSNMTSFAKAAVAVADIVIAFTAHVTFFGFITEMKNPRDFPKSLALLQSLAITFYVVVAVVIYYYAGMHVASPALGSAGTTVKKVAFGVACPTIIIAGVVNAHVCVKNLYVRMWRGTNVMNQRSFKAWGSWIAICAAAWIVAYIIASAIPVFHQLLGLVGALFCTWFTLGIPAIFWLYMRRGEYTRSWTNMALTAVNVCIFLISLIICVIGTYGSISLIKQTAQHGGSFSCADNSH